MSVSDSARPGGPPSMTTPPPPPCDSPNVVMRNNCPNEFPAIGYYFKSSSNALLIASTGASQPVNNVNDTIAVSKSISVPGITKQPVFLASSVKGVLLAEYTISYTTNPFRNNSLRTGDS